MKLMKWNDDKLKIYLTLDELLEKGLTAEELKIDCKKVHDIVQEIVKEACMEFGFKLAGALSVEIYSMQQEQGLIMIVSKEEDVFHFYEEEDDWFSEDHHASFQEKDNAVYSFGDIEDVVRMCRVIGRMADEVASSLYHIDGVYCMHFENIASETYDYYIPIIQEYGSLTVHSPFFLEEYGKLILKGNAIGALNKIF